MHRPSKATLTLTLIDEPFDRLLAGVIRQALADATSGPDEERQAAQTYLAQLGLLDDAGDVVSLERAEAALLWVCAG